MSNLGKWQELVELAKEAGGPEEFVESIFQYGKSSGRKEVLIIGGITIAITGTVAGIITLIKKNKNDKAKIEALKVELIESLNTQN